MRLQAAARPEDVARLRHVMGATVPSFPYHGPGLCAFRDSGSAHRFEQQVPATDRIISLWPIAWFVHASLVRSAEFGLFCDRKINSHAVEKTAW
jgi:hypothetical protein